MNRDIYLDKIVEYLVDDTIFDNDERRVIFPYIPTGLSFPFDKIFQYFPYSHLPKSLSDYCKDMYGLTVEEIIYVWEKFKTIITDIINSYE
jgi:hypothetical protein